MSPAPRRTRSRRPPPPQVAPADAANSSVHAVCRAVPDGLHGTYLERCAPAPPAAAAYDAQLAREITARSDELVAPWLRSAGRSSK